MLQLLVRQRCTDAAANDEQGHDGYFQAQLQMVVFTWLGQQAAGWQHQVEGSHAGEMQADDACTQQQAGAAFAQLVKNTRTSAQITR
ncbi:hypothetical protein D9M71_822740 [compost metagenome]